MARNSLADVVWLPLASVWPGSNKVSVSKTVFVQTFQDVKETLTLFLFSNCSRWKSINSWFLFCPVYVPYSRLFTSISCELISPPTPPPHTHTQYQDFISVAYTNSSTFVGLRTLLLASAVAHARALTLFLTFVLKTFIIIMKFAVGCLVCVCVCLTIKGFYF